ncbi:MAG: zf-HC2 domain-containing protein [Armatimonadetes bacterium]|nr:zf-HC2 domain-containing protein [Armatimonadota bacterium]
MKCGKVRDLFSSFAENAMDGKLSARVEEHLAQCELCRRAYDRFRTTLAMLDSIPEVDPPAGFHESVMAEVERIKRTTPAPVKWWRVDWQHVFTIRVPARAVAAAAVVVFLFAVAFQFSPVRTAVANWFTFQKPTNAPIQYIDEYAPPAPLPWNPRTSKQELLINIDSQKPGQYLLRLGTNNSSPLNFELKVGRTKYDGSVQKGQSSTIEIPAPPAGSVVVARILWRMGEQDRLQWIFLPSKLKARGKSENAILKDFAVYDMLRLISRQHGVAIIASGDLSKKIPYTRTDHASPDEAFYESLSKVGMRAEGVAESVYEVRPTR